jgi:hypothetical protein
LTTKDLKTHGEKMNCTRTSYIIYAEQKSMYYINESECQGAKKHLALKSRVKALALN